MTNDDLINQFKKELKVFFQKEEIQELLTKNDFQKIYQSWKYTPNFLTAFFLKCNISFLEYMEDIPFGCFSYLKLPSIFTLPKNIKTIRSYSFDRIKCNKFYIPKSVKYIEDSAFDKADIKEIIFEDPYNWKISINNSIDFAYVDFIDIKGLSRFITHCNCDMIKK